MLRLDCLTVETRQAEDHLLLSVVTEDGDAVPADVWARPDHLGAVERVSWQLPLMRTSSRALRAHPPTSPGFRKQVRRGVSSVPRPRLRPKPKSWMAGPMTRSWVWSEIKELDRQIKEAAGAGDRGISGAGLPETDEGLESE